MSEELVTLLSHTHAPPFIYLHHPHHPSSSAIPIIPDRCTLLLLDAIEHFNSRVLYTSALKQLDETYEGDITSWDGFARALSEIWASRSGSSKSLVNGSSSAKKGKGKAKATSRDGALPNGRTENTGDGQIVLLILHAERLRNVLGSNWSVITRLAELAPVPISVVLLSSIPWDEVRPPRGDAPEPIHLYLAAPTREGKTTLCLSQALAHSFYRHRPSTF